MQGLERDNRELARASAKLLDPDCRIVPEEGGLPAVAGEKEDLATLRLLPEETEGGGTAGVVKIREGVVQDQGDGVLLGQR